MRAEPAAQPLAEPLAKPLAEPFAKPFAKPLAKPSARPPLAGTKPHPRAPRHGLVVHRTRPEEPP